MAGSFIVTVGIGLLAGACFIIIPLIVAVRVFGVSCCLKKSKGRIPLFSLIRPRVPIVIVTSR